MDVISTHNCLTDCFVGDSVAASTQHSSAPVAPVAAAVPAVATASAASTGKLFSRSD